MRTQAFALHSPHNQLLISKDGDARKHLAFEEFEGSATTRRGVGHLLVGAVLLGSRSGIATTDHGDCASSGSFDDSVGHSLGSLFEGFEFEHACRTVPDDGLSGLDSVHEELGGFSAHIEAHPASRNAFGVRDSLRGSVGSELVGSDVVHREDDFLAGSLGLGHQIRNELGAFFVKQRRTDFDVVENLLEGESHATADDDLVGLVEEVVDELDLVSDLCTAEDGEERTRRIVEDLVECLEFLVHEEASGTRVRHQSWKSDRGERYRKRRSHRRQRAW